MKITHWKLRKSIQQKLLQIFVWEVTVRAAADILGIQPNFVMLFYRKIRQVIAYYLELQADEVFDGSVELDESYTNRTQNLIQYHHYGILKRLPTDDTC